MQHIVLLYVEDCVAASTNISMFFKERAAASKIKFASLELCPLKKYFEVKTD